MKLEYDIESYWQTADALGLTKSIRGYTSSPHKDGEIIHYASPFLAVPFLKDILSAPSIRVTTPKEKGELRKSAKSKGLWIDNDIDLYVFSYHNDALLKLLYLVKCRAETPTPTTLAKQLTNFNFYLDYLQENQGELGKEIFSPLFTDPVLNFTAERTQVMYVLLRPGTRYQTRSHGRSVSCEYLPLNREQILAGVNRRLSQRVPVTVS